MTDHENGGFQIVGADTLLKMEFAELHWTIEDILPAGTMLLFGKPKKGKSYLTLMVAMSVAAGADAFGKKTSGGHVLYLALEDSQRRLQRRLIACANVLGLAASDYAGNLSLTTTSKKIDTGLVSEVRDWMTAFPETNLIVVDMLKKVNAEAAAAKQLYEIQAETGHALTSLCHEYPTLTILVVHHSRKAESDDPFDLVSGTTGLSGSYDALAAITDDDSGRTLHVTGRDIEGAEIPLQMNDRGMYTLGMPSSDDIAAVGMSGARRRVFDAVPAGEAYSRALIVSGCNLNGHKMSGSDVDQQLSRLKRDGLIKRVDHGKYQKTGKRWFDQIGGSPID